MANNDILRNEVLDDLENDHANHMAGLPTKYNWFHVQHDDVFIDDDTEYDEPPYESIPEYDPNLHTPLYEAPA